MSVTSLVTDGFICYGGQLIPVPAPSSLNTPSITGAVEVRPKIRRATPPEEAGAPRPDIVSSQELKPQTTGHVTPEVTSVQPPKTSAAQELKPKIVKAEEED
jgi:hypothetical protein